MSTQNQVGSGIEVMPASLRSKIVTGFFIVVIAIVAWFTLPKLVALAASGSAAVGATLARKREQVKNKLRQQASENRALAAGQGGGNEKVTRGPFDLPTTTTMLVRR